MQKKKLTLQFFILLLLVPLQAHAFHWMDLDRDKGGDLDSIQTTALYKVFLILLAFLLIFGTSSSGAAADRSKDLPTRSVEAISNDIPYNLNAPYVSGEVLVKFTAGVDPTMAAEIAATHNCSIAESIQSSRLYRFKINDQCGVWEAVAKLKGNSNVKYAEPNFIVYPTSDTQTSDSEPSCNSLFKEDPASTPLDPYRGYQWNYDLINLPAAWNTISGGSGVIAAVLDTGALFNHPDMEGRFTYNGFDFLEGDPYPEDILTPQPDVPGVPIPNPAGHGTFVAGIIGAATNNGEGVAGMTWTGGIMPIRATADQFELSNALKYACGVLDDPNFPVNSTPVGVLNISMATAPSNALEEAVAACNEAGVIMVCATGNADHEVMHPAAYSDSYDKVIAVGATDYNSGGCPQRAPYSNYGDGLNVVAPGGDIKVDSDDDGYCDGILSTGWEQVSESIEEFELGYRLWEGTSFAAPHVTGLVALMLAHGANPDNVRSILEDTAWDLGQEGWDDDFGHGLIDARAALDAIPKIAVIQSSASTIQSVDKALSELGRVFEKFNTDDFDSIDLTTYTTVIVAMDGGAPNIPDIFHLANFANTGGNLIMLGGSPLSSFATAVDTYLLDIDTTSYSWEYVTTSPNMEVTAPTHPLAKGLPETYDFNYILASYYMIRSQDTAAEKVAANGDGETTLLKKEMSNNGALTWFINSPNETYWVDTADYGLLKQIIENGVGGAICKGDFDNNSGVDGSDLSKFAPDVGRTNCHTCPRCEGDFDTDNDVDALDLEVFAADFGRTGCP